MPFPMQPGKMKGSAGNVPEVIEMDAGSATCNKGIVIKMTASVAVVHPLVTDVTNMYGVSLEGDAAGVGDGPDSDILLVARINANTEFVAKCVTSSVLETDLSGVAIGDNYGLILVSGYDYVDLSDQSNVAVVITKIDDELDVVWFNFLASTIQESDT